MPPLQDTREPMLICAADRVFDTGLKPLFPEVPELPFIGAEAVGAVFPGAEYGDGLLDVMSPIPVDTDTAAAPHCMIRIMMIHTMVTPTMTGHIMTGRFSSRPQESIVHAEE